MAVRFTKEGDGHMNRLTQKVQAGKLCDMETAPKFISCGKLSILCIRIKQPFAILKKAKDFLNKFAILMPTTNSI